MCSPDLERPAAANPRDRDLGGGREGGRESTVALLEHAEGREWREREQEYDETAETACEWPYIPSQQLFSLMRCLSKHNTHVRVPPWRHVLIFK